MLWLFAVVALAGCGRVDFQDRHGVAGAEAGSNGSGSNGSNGSGDAGNGDSPSGTCAYITCTGTLVACCVNGTTTCTMASACSGNVIPCDVNPPFAPCTAIQGCCQQMDGGLACFDPPVPC